MLFNGLKVFFVSFLVTSLLTFKSVYAANGLDENDESGEISKRFETFHAKAGLKGLRSWAALEESVRERILSQWPFLDRLLKADNSEAFLQATVEVAELFHLKKSTEVSHDRGPEAIQRARRESSALHTAIRIAAMIASEKSFLISSQWKVSEQFRAQLISSRKVGHDREFIITQSLEFRDHWRIVLMFAEAYRLARKRPHKEQDTLRQAYRLSAMEFFWSARDILSFTEFPLRSVIPIIVPPIKTVGFDCEEVFVPLWEALRFIERHPYNPKDSFQSFRLRIWWSFRGARIAYGTECKGYLMASPLEPANPSK